MKKIAKGCFTIRNDRGLHTRPSTELVKLTAKYKSHIVFKFKRQEVNGKSILGILMMAAAKGSKIKIEAEGPDADDAVRAILDLSQAKFNTAY